jgi:hypothetical protein
MCFDNGYKVLRQMFFAFPARRDLALCRPVLAELQTGPALEDRQNLPDVHNARPVPRGA